MSGGTTSSTMFPRAVPRSRHLHRFPACPGHGLRILADQTVTLDVTLESIALQLREITVVAPENALVPRDEVTTKQRIDGQFVDALPVDRLNDVLALQPGVAETSLEVAPRAGRRRMTEACPSGEAGRRRMQPMWTACPYSRDTRVMRISGWQDVGPRGTALEIGNERTGRSLSDHRSLLAAYGNATGGIISIVTRTGGARYHGSLSYQTDELFGVNHGPGINRVEGAVSGPLAGKLTLALGGTIEGRQSVEEGFHSQDAPIFLPAGVDTVLRQASVVEDDTTTTFDERLVSDTTLVPLYNYAISRGRCDEFGSAGAAGLNGPDGSYIRRIRDNFGLACSGVRIPATARTLYTASAKLNYTYGTGSRLTLSAATSGDHGYQFDFIIRHLNRLSVPAGLRGFSERSRLATLSWTQNLSKSAERALALDVALSYQDDRTIGGQLDPKSAVSARAPFGGFILKPMRFLFDFETFPVDEHLVQNIRLHEGRMTPIDGRNTSFDPVDNLRNDAYGLYGRFAGFAGTLGGDTWLFREGGSFVYNPLNLYSEQRYIAKAALDWQADRVSRVKLGGEMTRYAMVYYGSFQRLPGDVYIEHPSGGTSSPRTVSISATWSWSAVSDTTPTTPGRYAPMRPILRATAIVFPGSPVCPGSIRPIRRPHSSAIALTAI